MGRKDPEIDILAALAESCEVFGCLPNDGGLLDQDPYLIEGMKRVMAGRAKHFKRKQEQEAKNAARH